MFKMKSFNTLQKLIWKKNLWFLVKQPFKIMGLSASLMTGYRWASPLCGSILPTYRCNSSCSKCPKLDMSLDQEEMTTQEIKETIDSFKKLGVSVIDFTGGEPLLRRDILEIIEYTSSKNCLTHLSTNGYLIDKVLARELLKTGIDSINISLDEICEEEVENRTGVANSFRLGVSAIANLIESRKQLKMNVRVSVVTVIDNANISRSEEIVRFVKETGADSMTLLLLHSFPETLKANSFTCEFKKDYNKLIALVEKDPFVETSSEYLNLCKDFYRGNPLPIPCVAGYSHIMVDAYRRVFPCFPWIELNNSFVFWEEGKSLRDVFLSQEYQKITKESQQCRKCYWNAFAEMSLSFNSFYREKR